MAFGLRTPGAEARAKVLRGGMKPGDPGIDVLNGVERRLSTELAAVDTLAG